MSFIKQLPPFPFHHLRRPDFTREDAQVVTSLQASRSKRDPIHARAMSSTCQQLVASMLGPPGLLEEWNLSS